MKIGRKIYSNNMSVNLPLRRKIGIYITRFFFFLKLLIAAIFAYIIITKQFSSYVFDVRQKVSELLADYGYSLENVVIAGQKNITTPEVIDSLNADIGTPIFSINLDDSLEKLVSSGWVKSAIIQRKLPDTIIVNLSERDPIALWQVNKELFVIDSDGEIIKNCSPEKFDKLPHLVGDDANIYAAELIENLKMNQELASKVIYAVRFGQRRWDLNLQENITVKMPQYDFKAAYQYLIDQYQQEKLFKNNIKSIDLRAKSKYYIEKNNIISKK